MEELVDDYFFTHSDSDGYQSYLEYKKVHELAELIRTKTIDDIMEHLKQMRNANS